MAEQKEKQSIKIYGSHIKSIVLAEQTWRIKLFFLSLYNAHISIEPFQTVKYVVICFQRIYYIY